MSLYHPSIGPNPTAEQLEKELTFLYFLTETLNPNQDPEDREQYDHNSRLMEELRLKLEALETPSQQEQTFAGEGWDTAQLPGNFPVQPASPEDGASDSLRGSISSMSTPSIPEESRKRSRGSWDAHDGSDLKRLSNRPSPITTPGTPSIDFQGTAGGRHATQPQNLRPNTGALQNPMIGFTNNQPPQNSGPFTYFNFNSNQSREQLLPPTTPRPQLGSYVQDSTNTPVTIDLTDDEFDPVNHFPGQNTFTPMPRRIVQSPHWNVVNDPFADLDLAYTGQQTGSGPTFGQYAPIPLADVPANVRQPSRPDLAFNQETMSNEELAQFLVMPNVVQVHATGYPNGFGTPGMMNTNQPVVMNTMNAGQHFYGAATPTIMTPNLSTPEPNDAITPQGNPDAITRLIRTIQSDVDIPRGSREPTPRGLNIELKEHQKLGLTWLKRMENNTDSKGGVLADDMGLGKTIQALSLILTRPSEDPMVKTTLIVAPVALIRQWEKEIQSRLHPTHRLSVYIYHGSGIRNADFAKLRSYDVVLTTYGTLATELKKKENRTEALLAEAEAADPTYVRPTNQKLSLIGRECMWYRVILDEAQCIKNRASLTSKASTEFQSKYRLCMTGTPMMNSVDEYYPLIRFLRIKPYNDWGRFRSAISNHIKANGGGNRDKGIRTLQGLIRATMLRRSKDSLIDGQPIIVIPPKHTEHDEVSLGKDELELYQALESKSQLQFNKYLKKGTVTNNYANILVLLLRLRQACCHPYLIKDLGVQVSTEGIDESTLLDRCKQLSQEVVNRLKGQDGFECPICFDGVLNPTIFVPCGHSCCGECFQRLIDAARAAQDEQQNRHKAKCPECRSEVSGDKITDYKHFLKAFCPERLSADEQGQEQPVSDDVDSESEEEMEDETLGGFVVPDDADDDFEPAPLPIRGDSKEQKSQKGKGKGKKKAEPKKTLAQLKKDSMRNKAAKRRYLRRLRREFISSAKIDKTMELVNEIMKNDPSEKMLIFSQFTSLLDLLEVPLSDSGVKYQRYDGSMRPNDRADAVFDFMENEETKLMLISLKAGNAGLNLTRASQVIILDPFWNPYIEDQAVDRAHRMMQEREVHVHRVLVPETVEDRICKLQDQKKEIIGSALDEKEGRNLSRLGLQDLMYLFGYGNNAVPN